MRKAGLKKVRENFINLRRVYLLSTNISVFDDDAFIITNNVSFLFCFVVSLTEERRNSQKQTKQCPAPSRRQQSVFGGVRNWSASGYTH